jgi:predicted GNAT superfamily acetyltransferase
VWPLFFGGRVAAEGGVSRPRSDLFDSPEQARDRLTSMSTSPLIRPMTEEDAGFVVALNKELEWAAAPMDAERLTMLRKQAELAVVVDDVEGPAAFAITLGPGTSYDSVNYLWFCGRFEQFLYLDRIMVAEHARRRGIGSLIYDAMEEHARAFGRMVCEVNSEPPNEPSLAFHLGRGYQERGHQRMPDGHEVVLLEKPL